MNEELIDLAYPYALDALDAEERADVDQRLADADAADRAEFEAQIRLTGETIAALTVVDAADPPPALRGRILDVIAQESEQPPERPISLTERRNRRRPWVVALAAAAAAAILAGGIGIGARIAGTDAPQNPTAVIMAAPDLRAVTRDIPGGGSATTMFAPSKDAAVLVMNDVTPPSPDSVYQMWLVDGDKMTSMGTMTDADVAPTTTVVLDGIGNNTDLAFTVEPPGGSTEPTGAPFAVIPLR
ncbi:anti-sigma-K factor RskA [Rhodococcus sp. 27YEA15]|uniref:anti-sigma factor n=1 Tax=Rhodococcus sp. 27YEA15 TaxID=3156259 RepID=UPI003C7B000B